MNPVDARAIRRAFGMAGVDARYVLTVLAIAAAYVIFAYLGFSLAFTTKQVTAVWPPTGIAVAALLLFGYRVWPGIWLGALVSNATSHETFVTAAAIAVGNTLGPLLAAYLLRRIGFDNALERLRDVLGLVVLGSALAMAVTATNGVFNLAVAGIVPWSSYKSVWWLWWTGDAMGVLLVAPLILTWVTPGRRFDLKWRNAVEVGAFGVALLAMSWLSFMSRLPLAYPVYPFVIWAALRFRQRATALAIVAISAIAVWGTTHGLGPFTAGSPDQRLVLLATFVSVLSVTGLVLGAVTAERRQAGELVDAAQRRFHVLAELVPQMVWTADATGWIDWHNHRWYEYTGQTPEEAAGWGWQRALHPEDYPRVMQDWPRSIATGKPFDMESRIRCHDGTFRWFLERAEPSRDAGGTVVRWYGTNTDVDHQKRALQESTRVAQMLQAALLPGKLPVRADLRFDALYLTAETEALIGGDWYDAFELPDGHIVVSIGDVAGHGIGAAAMAGQLRQGIFALALDTLDPAAVLAKVNRMLVFQESTMATALVAIVAPDLKSMRYASAGHPPPIVAASNVPAYSLPYGGMPLGVEPIFDTPNHFVTLEHDATVIFYTDGITEFSRDVAASELLLKKAVNRLVGDSTIRHPASAVQRAVMDTEKPSDDAVLMVLQLSPAATQRRFDESELRKKWTFHSSDAYSAHVSRHELMSFLRRFLSSEDELTQAELVIGEILANTVEHAPGLVDVEIDWQGVHPVLTIRDNGPGLVDPSVRLPENNFTENGRGLYLIGTLAEDVMVESGPGDGTKMTVVLSAQRDVSKLSPP